jgi:hypothetical protein
VGKTLKPISSQMPLTTQPPFHSPVYRGVDYARFYKGGKLI